VQLDHGQPDPVGDLGHLVERRVDEHAAHLGLAAQRRGDALGRGQIAAPRRAGEQDHPERPRPGLDGVLGVVEGGDPAELDARRTGVGHACIVRAGLPLPVRRLRPPGGELDLDGGLVTVAQQLDLDLVALLVADDRVGEVVLGAHRVAASPYGFRFEPTQLMS